MGFQSLQIGDSVDDMSVVAYEEIEAYSHADPDGSPDKWFFQWNNMIFPAYQ